MELIIDFKAAKKELENIGHGIKKDKIDKYFLVDKEKILEDQVSVLLFVGVRLKEAVKGKMHLIKYLEKICSPSLKVTMVMNMQN